MFVKVTVQGHVLSHTVRCISRLECFSPHLTSSSANPLWILRNFTWTAFIRPKLWNCQLSGETLGRAPGIFWPLMSPPTTSYLTQIKRKPYTASWSPLLSPCGQHIIVYIQLKTTGHIQSDQFEERSSAQIGVTEILGWWFSDMSINYDCVSGPQEISEQPA